MHLFNNAVVKMEIGFGYLRINATAATDLAVLKCHQSTKIFATNHKIKNLF